MIWLSCINSSIFIRWFSCGFRHGIDQKWQQQVPRAVPWNASTMDKKAQCVIQKFWGMENWFKFFFLIVCKSILWNDHFLIVSFFPVGARRAIFYCNHFRWLCMFSFPLLNGPLNAFVSVNHEWIAEMSLWAIKGYSNHPSKQRPIHQAPCDQWT